MAYYQLNDGTGYQMNYEIYAGLVPQNTLFIHGNLASNRWWYPALEVWQQKAKGKALQGSLIFAEFRGCGKSSAPKSVTEMNMKNLAKDFISLIEDQKLAPVNLVGHSTGGLIVSLMMSMRPDLFSKAVLLDPVGSKGVTFDETMDAAFEAMKNDRGIVSAVMGGTIYNNDPSTDFFNQVVVPDAHHAVKTIGMWVLQNLKGLDIQEDVKKISTPTLVLHGEHDLLLPIQDSKELANLMKNGQFKVVEGQGHCTNAENPSKFVQIASDFLFA